MSLNDKVLCAEDCTEGEFYDKIDVDRAICDLLHWVPTDLSCECNDCKELDNITFNYKNENLCQSCLFKRIFGDDETIYELELCRESNVKEYDVLYKCHTCGKIGVEFKMRNHSRLARIVK